MTDDTGERLRTGGCQCGGVRYEIRREPLALFVCHCRECRRQSSSAFGISVIVRRADFRPTRGAVKRWPRAADSGRTIVCVFCPDCGSRVWDEVPGDEETLCIKGGSLDQPVDLSAAVHIWTTRKLPGVIVPDGCRQVAQEPE